MWYNVLQCACTHSHPNWSKFSKVSSVAVWCSVTCTVMQCGAMCCNVLAHTHIPTDWWIFKKTAHYKNLQIFVYTLAVELTFENFWLLRIFSLWTISHFWEFLSICWVVVANRYRPSTSRKCSVMRCVAVCCRLVQCGTMCCTAHLHSTRLTEILKFSTDSNVLQHTATYCTTAVSGELQCEILQKNSNCNTKFSKKELKCRELQCEILQKNCNVKFSKEILRRQHTVIHLCCNILQYIAM